MRRLFALVLATTLLLGAHGGLAALAQDDEPVTLRFSSWGSPEQNAPISDAVDLFQEMYPNITVEKEFDPWDAYWDKKITQAAGDQLPDVFAVNHEAACSYAEAGQIADLTSYLSDPTISELLADVNSASLQNLNVSGQQVGFPFASATLLLFYNKMMFDDAGLDYPDPSWTLQDTLDAAAILTKDTNDDGRPDQWGYYPNYYNEETRDAIIHRFGASWFNADGTETLIDSPEAIAAFQFIQDLSYVYEVAPRPQDVEGIENPFAAGLIAMTEDGTFGLSDLREVTDFEWDVTSIPLGFDGQEGGGPLAGNPNFVVSAGTEHPEEAALLAAFLAGPEAQIALGKAQGRMPVNPAGLADWLAPPPENIMQVQDVMVTEPLIVEPLCVPHATEIDDLVERSFLELLANVTSAEEMVTDLAPEIQALLDTP
jgi:multiple sugar transport system substrate-binding protein